MQTELARVLTQRLKMMYHLFCDHNHRLDRESSVAVIEEIFERGSKQIDNQDVMKTFLTEIVNIRDSS